jgi:DNA-binding CsgD family transcriptional regulator
VQRNLSLDYSEQVAEIHQNNLILFSKTARAANQTLPSEKRRKYSPKQKFNIDIESFLALPCHVYWKDLNSTILGCNALQANSAGVKQTDMLGKTDYDFPWKMFADTIRNNDLDVMNISVSKVIEEPCMLHGKLKSVLSYKVPLCDLRGEVVGVFGLSFFTEMRQLIEGTISVLKRRGVATLPTALVSDVGRQNLNLTGREKECLYYLIRGMSTKQIGKALKLSHRTVEFYLERIKNKLDCHSRSELIAKLIDNGF